MKKILIFLRYIFAYCLIRAGVMYVPADFIDIEIIYIIISALVVTYMSFVVSTKEKKNSLYLSLNLLATAGGIFLVHPLVIGVDVVQALIAFTLAFLVLIFFSLLFNYTVREKNGGKVFWLLLLAQATGVVLIVSILELKVFF